jgi:hypothetical protein
MNSAAIVVGSLVKLEGVRAPAIVVDVDGDKFTLSGPRGEFLLTKCPTHWVRWPVVTGPFRTSSPRECKVEWVKAPADAA